MFGELEGYDASMSMEHIYTMVRPLCRNDEPFFLELKYVHADQAF